MIVGRMPELVYRLYEKRLANSLNHETLPGHIGVVLDGNRRWAKQTGASAAFGHQAGADKILEFLGWCEEFHIPVVTLYMLSTENLNRAQEELDALIGIISNTLTRLGERRGVKVHPVGSLDILPEQLAHQLRDIAEKSKDAQGLHVNVAIGYGGREEIVDAVKEFLSDEAKSGKSIEQIIDSVGVSDISDKLYTRGQPDPDLVIRTSGEQRLSGFLMWQSAYSEFYFCEALWPAFRRVDFIRALRDYSSRNRRFGS